MKIQVLTGIDGVTFDECYFLLLEGNAPSLPEVRPFTTWRQ